MKKIMITCISALLLTTGMLAQEEGRNHPMQERIRAQRVAFITEKLALTAEEAQSFWPVFNAFEAKMRDIRKDRVRRPAFMHMSDEEALDFIEKSQSLDQKELDLKISYTGRFLEVLPAQKVAQLDHIEKAFNRELLKTIRERRGR
jgi:hypothetical protein